MIIMCNYNLMINSLICSLLSHSSFSSDLFYFELSMCVCTHTCMCVYVLCTRECTCVFLSTLRDQKRESNLLGLDYKQL